MQLVECVPNFSEGVDIDIINQITVAIRSVSGVTLLNVDPGRAANRTVITFIGQPEPVVEAAFLAIKKAGKLIDMRKQQGEHPRMGATDVCPLIPISNITLEETAEYAKALGKRVGEELGIPVYLYEQAQTNKSRSNLSIIRAGEYERFFKKIKLPGWKPDFGPAEMDAKRGATVIGARKILLAYNVNLNTTSVKIAKAIASEVRESGRLLREGDPIPGEIITSENSKPERVPGKLKCVKAIGWFIADYKVAQVSMNLTDLSVTPLHVAFEEVVSCAAARSVKVTGSELIGLVPLQSMLDAGKYFLKKQQQNANVSEYELIKVAVNAMGLDQFAPFNPGERIIEYLLKSNPDLADNG